MSNDKDLGMPQNQSENTCITIVNEINFQASISSAPAEGISTNANNNEQPSSSSQQLVESSKNSNDDNANRTQEQLTNCDPSPGGTLNSEALALRLTSVEEERQRQETGNSEGEQNRNGRRILEYQLEYPITRFSRKWRRQEVQGFCCLAIEIICLSTLGVLGLRAVGYFDDIKQDEHLPLSFSWKILWEFFGNIALPKKLIECLFSSLGGKIVIHEDDNYAGLEPMGPMDVNYVLMDAFSSDNENNDDRSIIKPGTNPSVLIKSPDRNRCEFGPARHSLGWLVRFFLYTNFMAVLNLITSTILYTSLSVRRRKGMQVLLLLPSFFCFFVSIFQQIPLSFQYNYFDQSLIKEMHQTLVQSSPPYYVVPILDETQVHHQCCGVEFPGTWENFGLNVYPPSCCNSTAFDCSKLEVVRSEHVWGVGCFQIEHDRIHSFEKWALFLYALKVIAEVGIFCTLSDLTRFDYPPPEVLETSRCDFRDYQVKSRGVMHIKGVTKDGRVVVESRYFLPWRLVPSRTDMLNGVQLYMKTDQNQTKGSVEVVKRHNVANFLNEDIQIDLSRKNRGIFVFTLN